MNRIATMMASAAFAVVSTVALAQTTTPAPAPAPGPGQRPAIDPKTQQDLSRNSPNPAQQRSVVEQSKQDPKPPRPNTRDPATFKAAQELSRGGGTNPADARANVEASKAQSPKRQRLPNVKDLTPEERAQLRRELEAASKP